jgi:hypothetical protein
LGAALTADGLLDLKQEIQIQIQINKQVKIMDSYHHQQHTHKPLSLYI